MVVSLHLREQSEYVPDAGEAVQLAQQLLHGDRLRHVARAGRVAAELPLRLSLQDRGLLVAAATLHDVGYSVPVRRTGFHPWMGAAICGIRG